MRWGLPRALEQMSWSSFLNKSNLKLHSLPSFKLGNQEASEHFEAKLKLASKLGVELSGLGSLRDKGAGIKKTKELFARANF